MPDDDAGPGERLWSTGRIIATVIVVALIATVGYTVFSGHPEEKAESKVVLPGATAAAPGAPAAPVDYDVPTVDGRTIRLSDYRGKVLVVDFWATWCPPCRKEIPQLVRIAGQNRDRGLEVIGLHIDDRGRSTPEDIKQFVEHYNINYTIGLASDDIFVAYLGREETAIPQTLVFDRQGRLVKHFIGYDETHARALDEAVNRALAGA